MNACIVGGKGSIRSALSVRDAWRCNMSDEVPVRTEEQNVAHDKREHSYVYDFVCEGCKSEGELLVPIDERRSFACPEGCGAVYVQWHPPGHMAQLKCVVRPVFSDE